jgi:predicted DsbA family dithiol-disulfide isomerase
VTNSCEPAAKQELEPARSERQTRQSSTRLTEIGDCVGFRFDVAIAIKYQTVKAMRLITLAKPSSSAWPSFLLNRHPK